MISAIVSAALLVAAYILGKAFCIYIESEQEDDSDLNGRL